MNGRIHHNKREPEEEQGFAFSCWKVLVLPSETGGGPFIPLASPPASVVPRPDGAALSARPWPSPRRRHSLRNQKKTKKEAAAVYIPLSSPRNPREREKKVRETTVMMRKGGRRAAVPAGSTAHCGLRQDGRALMDKKEREKRAGERHTVDCGYRGTGGGAKWAARGALARKLPNARHDDDSRRSKMCFSSQHFSVRSKDHLLPLGPRHITFQKGQQHHRKKKERNPFYLCMLC